MLNVKYINHGSQTIHKVYTPVYIPYIQFVDHGYQILHTVYTPGLQTLSTVNEPWSTNYMYIHLFGFYIHLSPPNSTLLGTKDELGGAGSN